MAGTGLSGGWARVERWSSDVLGLGIVGGAPLVRRFGCGARVGGGAATFWGLGLWAGHRLYGGSVVVSRVKIPGRTIESVLKENLNHG